MQKKHKRTWGQGTVFDPLTIRALLFFITTSFMAHFVLFWDTTSQITTRTLYQLSIGFGYDVMISACLVLLCLPLLLVSQRRYATALRMVAVFYVFFLFLDAHYLDVFGTHLPFHVTEYLESLSNFRSSTSNVIFSRSFFVFCLVSLLALIWIKSIN